MSNKIRVAFIVTSLANKGPIRVVQTIINTSIRLGLSVDFSLFYLKTCNELTINCKCIPYSRVIDFSEFDIIHSHGIRPDAIAFIKRRQIKKHIVTIHNFVYEDLRYTYNKLIAFFFGRLWIYLWKHADLLITISNTMAEYYKDEMHKNNIIGIHNGLPQIADNSDIDNSDIPQITSFVKPGKKIIGTACAVTRTKGLDQVIDFLAVRNEYQFMLIGDGKELINLKLQAKKLGVENRCLFLGYRLEAHRYFKHFDIFAMPSRAEGFGLTLLEAARFRIPIICSDIPTFRELFLESEVQFFEIDNAVSLDSAVEQLCKKMKLMTEAAWKKFIGHYTDEIMAKKYFKFYSKLKNDEPLASE